MTRVPFHGMVVGIAGAWLATLGACGRTAPTLDDTFGYGDDDTALTGGASGTRGGSSARGGTTSTGGSSRGGTTSTGGSSRGGTTSTGGSSRGGTTSTGGSVNAGGASGTGAGGGPARGGSSFGGSVSDGGTVAVGGSFAVGGSVGLGGTTGRGGSSGSSAAGGTGAQGGTGTMTSISCGDEVCDPSASVCCARRSQPSYCVDPGADCPGATLTCSGPGQCGAGEVCCFHGRSSFCTTDCQVSEGERGNPPTIVLCDSSADCGPDETCVLAPRGIAYCGENL